MSERQRIEFPNGRGQTLAAALHVPAGSVRAWAVFAHCFTCGKDSAAASRIARGLADRGIGVLRFDFTGLGGSEGDFENEDFSANVEDLVAAARWLEAEHGAPQLLVGHSLGGTAVLAAAPELESVRAVATIGAPSSPAHVVRQFAEERERILREGRATVDLAGRPFTIRKEFVEDVEAHPLRERLGELRKALLILHAPLDGTVPVDEATALFVAARHPKSFVSLDGADHLLSRAEDADYVAGTVAAWATRYLQAPEDTRPDLPGGRVQVRTAGGRFRSHVFTDHHHWLADEPRSMGGTDEGPDPYEHLLAALGTCTGMTLRMYADRKGWDLADVIVTLRHEREHVTDCEGCEDEPRKMDVLTREIAVEGALDEEQRARLLEIADRCPVHRTLEGALRVDTWGVAADGSG